MPLLPTKKTFLSLNLILTHYLMTTGDADPPVIYNAILASKEKYE
jgi:hypothetical protein